MNKSIRIVAFGDSLTQGAALTGGEQNWTEAIAERFDVEVINKGIGGNNSAQALERMEQDVISLNPDIVIINFGMNDHVIVSESGQNAVSQSDFRNNISEMISRTRAVGAKPLLVTPNAIMEEYYYKRHIEAWYEKANGASAVLEKYCDIIRSISKDENVPLADVKAASELYPVSTLVRTPEQGGFEDGVHPYGYGIKVYTDVISAALMPLMER